MRIAQVVPSLEARHGGPSRSVLGLATGLAACGHEVELLATEPGETTVTQPAPGLTVRRFARQWPQSLSVSAGLRRYLGTRQFDVIHNHALWLRPLHYAAQAARRMDCPLIISPRGMMSPWAWQHRRNRKALAQSLVHPAAFQHATAWHATSGEEAADIRRLGFAQPVCVSPNGIDLPTTPDLTAARHYWFERCPALGQKRVALFYSRFHPKKRVLELLDLWGSKAPPGWLLLLVGIPEAYTVAALNDYALRQSMAAKVAIFDGTDTPAPYAAAEVYLLPTHSENFGLTIAEAMAHGLPVITTDAAPWQGLRQHDAGQCVPWAEFGHAMTALLRETPAALAARGMRGRQWMEAEFTWAKPAAKLAEFYTSLIAPSP
jgi:glycosyltransferase involved in cell wall biosynthesis